MKTFINVAQMKLATLQADQFVETGGYYTKGDAGAARYLIVAAQAFDTWGDHGLANGTIAVLQVSDKLIAAQWGVIDNGADMTAPIQAMVDYGNVTGVRKLTFGYGSFKTTGIFITEDGFEFIGRAGERPTTAQGAGTRLSYTGNAGALFLNGADDGLPWSDNLYDGPQGLSITRINLHNGSALRTTPLNSSPASSYGVGTYGVQDWRGGHIYINDCIIEGFEYNFWGVNSDFSKLSYVTSLYSKFGCYFGPRSDQTVLDGLYSFYCDTMLVVDGASNMTVNNTRIVLCGSLTDYPVMLRKGCSNVVFNEPWLENYGSINDGLEFFDVGSEDGYGSDVTAVLQVDVNNPTVAVGATGSSGPKHLVSVSKGERIKIKEPVGARGTTSTSNLTGYFYIPSGVTGTGFDLIYEGVDTSKVLVNDGAGVPNICSMETSSQWKFGSASGRLSVIDEFGAAGADELRISQADLAGRLLIDCPSYTTGQTTRVNLQKILIDRNSIPSTGTYEQGDYVRNTAAVVLGAASSQYIVTGWYRLTTGSGHVLNTDWVETRALTGT